MIRVRRQRRRGRNREKKPRGWIKVRDARRAIYRYAKQRRRRTTTTTTFFPRSFQVRRFKNSVYGATAIRLSLFQMTLIKHEKLIVRRNEVRFWNQKDRRWIYRGLQLLFKFTDLIIAHEKLKRFTYSFLNCLG